MSYENTETMENPIQEDIKVEEELLQLKMVEEPSYENVFTEKAKKFAKDVGKIKVNKGNGIRRPNILLYGEAGSGKSVFARQLHLSSQATDMPTSGFYRVNFSASNDVQDLVGQQMPMNDLENKFISLRFQAGSLYKAVDTGAMFLAEQQNRALMEVLSRLFNLLDYSNEFEVPENSEVIPVHPNFWYIGTMNPVGKGYTTNQLDKALEQRFTIKYEFGFDDPIIDEENMIFNLLGKDKAFAERMMSWVNTVRKEGNDTVVSSREVSDICSMISNGIPIKESIEYTLSSAYSPEKIKQMYSTALIKFRKVVLS